MGNYNAKNQADYRRKTKQYNVIYRIHEMPEAERLQRFLDNNNTSFSQYVKALIRKDLNEKGME